MKKQIVFLVLFLVLAAPCQEQMKLAVLEPEGKGLSKDEIWMLSLVQSSIAADFNKYSPITIIDRQNLEAIIAEQKRSLSAITSDKDAIAIGNLANASHILTGKITKTPKTFMLELAITDAETGKRQASYSPKGITPSQVEDLSALKAASADLLKQLGVSLTESQLEELRGPVAATQVQAQTALARGVVAERQGTSVAALSYFYQAAAFDPTLVEAVKRSSVMSANISGINLGENIRNDIVWRKKWVEQLKETEETFYKIINNADPPYTLYYSTAIETKNIDYKKETADLSIALSLLANAEWFNAMQKALKAAQAVMDGLNVTNRKKDWGLDKWPEQGVTDINPFASKITLLASTGWHNEMQVRKQMFEKARSNYTDCLSCRPPNRENFGQGMFPFPVEFELVNQRGKIIGKQVAKLSPYISIDKNFFVRFDKNLSGILTFNAVKANDISDNLTIRLASVNGTPPKTARFPIIAISTKEFPEYQTRLTAFVDSRDDRIYRVVEIGAQTWIAENLDFNAEGSKCYKDDPSYCQKYGRLYDWNTAMKICPVGWHLPSDKEWQSLVDFAGGNNVAGKELKAKGWGGYNTYNGGYHSYGGTDVFGFSALPGGRCNDYGYFNDVGSEGHWWSSSASRGDDAYVRIMDNGESVKNNDYDKISLRSVRCIKDE